LQNQSSEFRAFTSYADSEYGYREASRDDQDHRLGTELVGGVNTFAYAFTKRIFDLTIVTLIFPFVCLVGLVIAVLIAIDSPGPVFFTQRRIHRGGAFFSMWKFRTMCADSSEVLERHFAQYPHDRHEWAVNRKLKNDPRVSTLGLFLRRTSLDELPQIFNVFTGTMSLVGPRPIVAAEVEKYGDDFVYYLAVKPGITGLWQASGRSTLSYPERVSLDRYYVEHWSPWLEARILIRTIRAVTQANGAY